MCEKIFCASSLDSLRITKRVVYIGSGAGLEGGLGATPPPPSGIRNETLPAQRVPLCTILRQPYLGTNPKILLISTPISTRFTRNFYQNNVFLVL